jgi:lantibiotic modifying enzyme
MLIDAWKFFKDDKYLESLLKTGEVIWKKGLLKKGNGICHGISGNAYALHSIYRATGDEKWLHRTMRFTLCTFNKEVQKICI